MFTGLVTGMGETADIVSGAGEARFTVRPLFPVDDWKKGESIAVNGVCLSVETFGRDFFTAYASQETLRASNLGELRKGDKVNLERALALGDRLGGHLVSAHSDAVAVVETVQPVGSSTRIRVRFPKEFSSLVIPKGSVAIDGVSLTVNTCGQGFLEVNVIPETLAATTVGFWKKGRRVNFETDMLGKYVERILGRSAGNSGSLSLDLLRDNGF
ncbi:MAG: riboflavin synthase [Desulfovibrio sp.]|jgi:riboflavin synthase|nr:riboflavin synthase [Desulfovibrio sp.]